MNDNVFPGESLWMIRSFREVAASIKMRQIGLEPQIEELERELTDARQRLAGATDREDAHAAIERIFDLRDRLGRMSNNPNNRPKVG